jgi:hypothetical protein
MSQTGIVPGYLQKAFENDGYIIKRSISKSNKIGVVAENVEATNYNTGQKKRIYYLEGDSKTRGYLLGRLAAKEILRMATDYVDGVIFEFFEIDLPEIVVPIKWGFGELLTNIIKLVDKNGIPQNFFDEADGIIKGCKEEKVLIDKNRLLALNIGVDVLCSRIYTGDFQGDLFRGLKKLNIKMPVMRNGFAAFGHSKDRTGEMWHYFGRDFMFPTANVFQDVACMMIHNPDPEPKKKVLPFVCVTAPGFIGSIAAMNINGVAAGVDMAPSANCDTEKIGLNSLLMTRYCIQYGSTANEAVSYIRKAPRSVSWIYIIADGNADKACIIEAGCNKVAADFLDYPPDDLKILLPNDEFIKEHSSVPFEDGIMVRWSNYCYPNEYLQFNENLYNYYNKRHWPKVQYIQNDFKDEKGLINKTYSDKNLPSTFYFSPQRENHKNLAIATNHYIIPEMRFYGMSPWITAIVGDKLNNSQWRYDVLNKELLNALESENGMIDYNTAKKLIDFLAPYGKYPDYYSANPRSKDGKEIMIKGSVSMFDLKNKTVESHFGYYCDDWIKVSLLNYFPSHAIT